MVDYSRIESGTHSHVAALPCRIQTATPGIAMNGPQGLGVPYLLSRKTEGHIMPYR